jgi:hypothetical protein
MKYKAYGYVFFLSYKYDLTILVFIPRARVMVRVMVFNATCLLDKYRYVCI